MSSPLDRLAGPGKALTSEPPDAREFAGLKRAKLAKCHEIRNLGEYEGDLDIDDPIVADLVDACKAVVAKLDALPPLNIPRESESL